MTVYRVYYVGSDGHFFAVNDFDAADDAAAIAKAGKLCAEHPGCHAVEIWEGERQVHTHHNVS